MGRSVAGPGLAEGSPRLRGVLCGLALLSVAPLLAWVYGLGPFALWYWWLTAPALVLLAGSALVISRDPGQTALAGALRAGAIGGLLGTIGYDLVRVPFEAAGVRVLSPIDSYGLLLTGAASSSPVTGFAGWFFHVTNGVCFGVAFAMVAAGKRLPWAVGWAMVLETATIVTPFVDRYGLAGRYELMAVAYGAHLAYGIPLGMACRDPQRFGRHLDEIAPHAAAGALGAAVVALGMWQRPWAVPPAIAAGRDVAAGPSAVVRGGGFSPNWLRVRPGGCVGLRNDDAAAHRIEPSGRALAPGAATRVCVAGVGVHRVKVDGAARSGGFVLVDPEAR